MELEEIQKAVLQGKAVCFGDKDGVVFQDNNGDFKVKHPNSNLQYKIEYMRLESFYTRLDLSRFEGKVFTEYIYPLLAKEFLYGLNLASFMNHCENKFELNDKHREEIKLKWELKEYILA